MGRLQRLLASATLLALGTSQQLTYQGCVALDTSSIATTAELYPAGPAPCLAYCTGQGYSFAGLTAQFCSCWANAPAISRTYTNRNNAACSFNCDSPYESLYCGGIDVTNLNFLYSYYANPAAAAAASSSNVAANPARSSSRTSATIAASNIPGPGHGPGTSGSSSRSVVPARTTRISSSPVSSTRVPIPGSPGAYTIVPVAATPGSPAAGAPSPAAGYPPYGPPPGPGVNPGGPGGPGGPGQPGAGPGSIPGTGSGALPPYGPPPAPGVNPGGPGGPGGPGLPGAGPGSIPGTANGQYPAGYFPSGVTPNIPVAMDMSLVPGQSFALSVARFFENVGDELLSYVPNPTWLHYNAGNSSFYGTVPIYQPPINIVLNITAGRRTTLVAKRAIYEFNIQLTIVAGTANPTLTLGAPGGPGGVPSPGPEVSPGSNGSLSYTNTVYETCTRTYTRCPICEAETRVVAVPVGTTCIPAKFFTTPCVYTTNKLGHDGKYTWGVYTTDSVFPYNPAESTPVLSAWDDATTRVSQTVLVGITRTVEVVTPTGTYFAVEGPEGPEAAGPGSEWDKSPEAAGPENKSPLAPGLHGHGPEVGGEGEGSGPGSGGNKAPEAAGPGSEGNKSPESTGSENGGHKSPQGAGPGSEGNESPHAGAPGSEAPQAGAHAGAGAAGGVPAEGVPAGAPNGDHGPGKAPGNGAVPSGVPNIVTASATRFGADMMAEAIVLLSGLAFGFMLLL